MSSQVVGQQQDTDITDGCVLYNPESLHTIEFNGTEGEAACARQITEVDRIDDGLVAEMKSQGGTTLARASVDSGADRHLDRTFGMRFRGDYRTGTMKVWFDDIRVLRGSLIDGAEDGDISEYVQSEFDQWYISSDSYVGDWSIAAENTAGGGGYNTSLISFSDGNGLLPYYPQIGDVMSFWTKYTENDHTVKFGFGIEDDESNNKIQNSHVVTWGRRGNKGNVSPYFALENISDGNDTVLDVDTLPFEEYANEWVRILVSWGGQGNVD